MPKSAENRKSLINGNFPSNLLKETKFEKIT